MKKKVVGLLMAVVLGVGLSACSSTGRAAVNSEASPQAQALSSNRDQDYNPEDYGLDGRLEWQGIRLDINTEWKVSPSSDHYSFSTGEPCVYTSLYTDTKGSFEDLYDAYDLVHSGGVFQVNYCDDWEDNLATYDYGYLEDEDGEPWSFLLLAKEKNGDRAVFMQMMNVSGGWTDERVDEIATILHSSLKYIPSETDFDYLDDSDNEQPASQESQAESKSGSAESSYGPGVFKVGVDMPAGEYKLESTNSLGGYWEVKNSSSADAPILDNDNFDSSTYLTVSDGQYLELSRCKATPVK